MANKVTNEDILRINELYYQYKTYAEVSRQTGFSASTVKKYVIKGWKPVDESKFIRFDLNDLPNVSTKEFIEIDDFGALCVLSNKEREEIKQLWEELEV